MVQGVDQVEGHLPGRRLGSPGPPGYGGLAPPQVVDVVQGQGQLLGRGEHSDRHGARPVPGILQAHLYLQVQVSTGVQVHGS